MNVVKNPILSGFYPDPSICRVENDFYLVHSSFAYFPGVPIFHSKNLADWTQIGNILNRKSQLPLKNSKHSGGIFAPTIRYHENTYYMITTNVSGGGNFIVTATNPRGPWSEPYYLGEKAIGIDPSLFFDEDGTCYYVGTRPNPTGVQYNGDWEIWVQELDLNHMQLVGESYAIWKGALKDVIWPEGPHIYHKDGYYYVLNAEGGTGPDHAVTVARSRHILGPYENNPKNPILTHRHLGKDYPVVYVGHGDLVDDADGNWYVVMLASRRCEGYIGLGRETFLAKVVWEDGWPVVNPGIGKLEDWVSLPYPCNEKEKIKKQSLLESLTNKQDVLMLRNPSSDFYTLEKDKIMMKLLPETLKELKSPAYLGFRQLEYFYSANLTIELDRLLAEEEAGIAILQSNEYYILFRIKQCEECEFNHCRIQLVKCIKEKEQLLAERLLSDFMTDSQDHIIGFKIIGHGQRADFIFQYNQVDYQVLKDVDIHEMSTEVAGGFVGNTIGVYASSCGRKTKNTLEVKDFHIEYELEVLE
ncbi:glycoside hydrolase family 43 protein [Clostridium sp. Marseille-P299]|uniref:glycoside hydrolase family 43 protein n=1 Tax=Clostridium sp. Marseille-P299 TaxID=1805477 RepID=UPI0008308479|nr:glycoside hydrolase family 43 protein [Clostridium sp. Marseille-P299]